MDRALLVVERIPAGRVATYGDIGRLVGAGPRRIGTIMRLYSHNVPYWRVVGANGDPGGHLLTHFRPHWDEEGIMVKPNGLGCRIVDYRADLNALDAAYRTALEELLATASTPLPPLSTDVVAALHQIGVRVLEHVIDHSEAELAALPQIGPAEINTLARAVTGQGWIWSRAAPVR